jgi:iron complex transport system substrate-binding protein
LLAICPLARISAVSTLALNPQYSNVVKEAKQVGQQVTANVEHILNLNPDLIIVASYSRAETVQLLQAMGAPVLRLTHFRHLEDIKQNIKIIGEAIGLEKEATALITQMQQKLVKIHSQLPKTVPSPRVVFYNQWYYTAGSLTTFDDMLHLIGATNISAEHGIQGYTKLDPEQLIAWKPDFIVTEANQREFSVVRQRLLAHPAIGMSIAHESTRIIVVDTRYLSSVSHHIVHALEILADKLYP